MALLEGRPAMRLVVAATLRLLLLSSTRGQALAPRIRAFSFQEDLSIGDSTAITCALRRGSRGPHAISWRKDASRPLFEGSGRVSVHRQADELSVLTIRDIGYEDAGNYTCVASNDHGWDHHTTELLASGQRWHGL
ncbi:fibroblast growth factor receptor 3-like [Dermacentor andersoni]|uniref:fibroblast growth factor receptor 3-like n=1 Tax=Dermacentor andersoni TaxID=34620 RepID=UPI0024160332|nr:fibroblast growth factor receptor 3-like [Dermacentor andersoni]